MESQELFRSFQSFSILILFVFLLLLSESCFRISLFLPTWRRSASLESIKVFLSIGVDPFPPNFSHILVFFEMFVKILSFFHQFSANKILSQSSIHFLFFLFFFFFLFCQCVKSRSDIGLGISSLQTHKFMSKNGWLNFFRLFKFKSIVSD